MKTTVVTAETRDLDTLSELLAEAFFDLPPSPWLISDETARRAIFPLYFRVHLQHGLEHGLVHTTPDWAAVALWLPVGTGTPTLPDRYEARLAALTPPWTGRFVAFDAAMEDKDPVGEAHHYLALLGVRPDRQGRGIGSALLEAHHTELDHDRMPAYLEASSDRNRQLYLRHGYQDIGGLITLPEGGPRLYPMWRHPSPQDSPGGSGGEATWNAGMTGDFRKPTVVLR